MSEETNFSSVGTFPLYITKAVVDSDTGEMRWTATTSDILPDSYDDEMSLELYNSFLRRIENREQVPLELRSEYWSGGMPYLSIAHFSDANGKNVPGNVSSVYVDGKQLKAKGTFDNTPLGTACFQSVQKSIIKRSKGASDNLIRISIGFLDWKHVHKKSGTTFVRESIDHVCDECVEMAKETGYISGLRFLDGQLIHLAMTTVPVNNRTIMEPDMSEPTTQAGDAAEIVGDELATEILENEKNHAVALNSLVTKSETEEAEAVEEVTEETPQYVTVEMLNDAFGKISDLISKSVPAAQEEEPTKVVEPVAAEVHPLDAVYAEFKSTFDRLDKSDAKNMEQLNPSWEAFAGVIRSSFARKEEVPPVVKPEDGTSAALETLMNEISELKSIVAGRSGTVRRGVTSVQPEITVQEPAGQARSSTVTQPPATQKRGVSIRELARRSVGLNN